MEQYLDGKKIFEINSWTCKDQSIFKTALIIGNIFFLRKIDKTYTIVSEINVTVNIFTERK